MNLSTLPVLLAVVAVAFAAPENYGKYGQSKSKPAIKTTTVASDEPLEFDCSDKEDRGYVIGCNQDYFLCWKGQMTKASCPDGMMFNQDNGQCDFNQNIFECSGVRTSTVLPEQSTLKPIDFDCSKLTDGDYAFSSDCQVNYVSCVGGQGIERTCPDELQFDPHNRLCERIENIEACGGAPTTVASEMEIQFDCPSPSGSFGVPGMLCSSVYYLCNDNIASIAVCDEQMIWDEKNKACALAKDIPDCSFDCSNKADAAYSEGCSQYYWWCWQERAIKQACPEGMMFDGEHGLCDFESNVFECSGVRTTTPLADEPSTMMPVDFDCKGLEDGNHAFLNGEKCQPKFVSCVGGLAWEMTCPDGLLFDPDQLLCERLEAIVACGGTAEPITSTLKDYGYQTTTPLPVRRHHIKTTTVADVPTTKAYSHKRKLTTTLADIPTTKSYGGYNVRKTTTLADIPTTKAYAHKRRTTTLADEPISTTLGYSGDDYGQSINLETTTLMDVPETTTRRHHKHHKMTTVADVPKDNYGSYETTTLADVPITTTRRSYNHRTTTLADVPTTKSYGYNVRKTTTLADIPTTKAYSHKRKLTTTLADIPTTQSYGGYETTTLADVPETTTRRHHKKHHKMTTVADVPKDNYGSYETTTLADIPTTKAYSHKRKLTTTLADIPTTKSYGGYNVRKTTLADIPTTKSYGGYNVRRTTTLADIPETTTLRQRSTYAKVKPIVADQPKRGY